MIGSVTDLVLEEVWDERKRQDEKWNEQNHPMVGGEFPDLLQSQWARQADFWKQTNDKRVVKGNVGFDGILLEEVYEALCETDLDRMRVELIQVAAVAVSMVEALDRQKQRGR